jgi:hypothetical protein
MKVKKNLVATKMKASYKKNRKSMSIAHHRLH